MKNEKKNQKSLSERDVAGGRKNATKSAFHKEKVLQNVKQTIETRTEGFQSLHFVHEKCQL